MKNRIKKIGFCIIVFLIVLFIKNKAQATSITISPSSPKVGDTVTITVTVPNVHTVDVTAKVSGVVSGTIKVVGGDIAGTAKSYSNSATYKCEKEGNISVEITNNSTAVLEGNYIEVAAQKNVTVSKAVSSNANSNSNTGNSNSNPTQQTPTKSNIATLSNLGIRPNDFSGFKANTLSYNTEVPYETEKIEIYASKGQSGQTISGTGTKTLKEGQNSFNITVTAEDGKTTKTYTINVTRKQQGEIQEPEVPIEENPEEPVEVFGLTELKIEGIEFEPQFQTDIYEYKMKLTENIEKLNITAIATEVNSKVEIIGNENLKDGENIVTIIVKSENEEKSATYQLTVNKETQQEKITNIETDHSQMLKRIIIASIVGGMALIIIIIAIVIKIRKNENEEFDSGYIPYKNLNTENTKDNDIMEENSNSEGIENDIENTEDNISYEDVKKKKHPKGKRFK